MRWIGLILAAVLFAGAAEAQTVIPFVGVGSDLTGPTKSCDVRAPYVSTDGDYTSNIRECDQSADEGFGYGFYWPPNVNDTNVSMRIDMLSDNSANDVCIEADLGCGNSPGSLTYGASTLKSSFVTSASWQSFNIAPPFTITIAATQADAYEYCFLRIVRRHGVGGCDDDLADDLLIRGSFLVIN